MHTLNTSMQVEVSNLYPVPLGKTQFTGKITKKMTDYALLCPKNENVGNLTSVDKNVLERKEFKVLKKFCVDSVNHFFQRTMRPKNDVELYITQSWLNISDTHQYHHKHHHPNSYYSGVFYLHANPEVDKISFSNPNKFFLYNDPESFTVWNSNVWEVPAGTGILYMFPSDFEHEVPKVKNFEKRISLSFNTWIRGNLGVESESTFISFK